MLKRLKFLFDKNSSNLNSRKLDAAQGGRRYRGDNGTLNASDVHSGSHLIAERTAHFVLNTAEGAAIKSSLVANLVGSGIVPRPTHKSPVIKKLLAQDFLSWTDRSDALGQTDFYGLQAHAAADMVVYGEALFAWDANPATGEPQLRRLHPAQLDRAKNVQLQNGGHINQGVEFNRSGRIVGYWLLPSAPGESLVRAHHVSIFHPASDIIHMFRQDMPGQVRGLSWLAPVLLSGRDLDQLMDAMLVRAKVAAMFVGSLYDPDGSNGGFEGEQTGSEIDTTAEPGTIRIERSGSRMEWNKPPDSGDLAEHAAAIHRRLAVGSGATYSQVSGDYSKANYSSERASQLEYRRKIEMVQHGVIVPQFCAAVWTRFLQWQVLRGRISATAFNTNRDQFNAKWLPSAWPWVDPAKDMKAEVLAVDNHFKSRSEVIAGRGYDPEAIDAEIASDNVRAENLGFVAPKEAPSQTASEVTQ